MFSGWSIGYRISHQGLLTDNDGSNAIVTDATTNSVLRVLSGLRGSQWSVARSPDGSVLVTGGADRSPRCGAPLTEPPGCARRARWQRVVHTIWTDRPRPDDDRRHRHVAPLALRCVRTATLASAPRRCHSPTLPVLAPCLRISATSRCDRRAIRERHLGCGRRAVIPESPTASLSASRPIATSPKLALGRSAISRLKDLAYPSEDCTRPGATFAHFLRVKTKSQASPTRPLETQLGLRACARSPPCMRQRPLGMAGPRQGRWCRLDLAPHRTAFDDPREHSRS